MGIIKVSVATMIEISKFVTVLFVSLFNCSSKCFIKSVSEPFLTKRGKAKSLIFSPGITISYPLQLKDEGNIRMYEMPTCGKGFFVLYVDKVSLSL